MYMYIISAKEIIIYCATKNLVPQFNKLTIIYYICNINTQKLEFQTIFLLSFHFIILFCTLLNCCKLFFLSVIILFNFNITCTTMFAMKVQRLMLLFHIVCKSHHG